MSVDDRLAAFALPFDVGDFLLDRLLARSLWAAA
jgi:hypothetical protein